MRQTYLYVLGGFKWSSAVAVKAEAANHPELLRSRALVVGVVGEVAP